MVQQSATQKNREIKLVIWQALTHGPVQEKYIYILLLFSERLYLCVLHDSQLGQHGNSFKIYAECPENPVNDMMRGRWMN